MNEDLEPAVSEVLASFAPGSWDWRRHYLGEVIFHVGTCSWSRKIYITAVSKKLGELFWIAINPASLGGGSRREAANAVGDRLQAKLDEALANTWVSPPVVPQKREFGE